MDDQLYDLLQAFQFDEDLADILVEKILDSGREKDVICYLKKNSDASQSDVLEYILKDHRTISDVIRQKQKKVSSGKGLLSPLYLPLVQILPELPLSEYYAGLPAVKSIWIENGLAFEKPITIFVGENGIGKSTLIEAIAVAAGFNAEGGSQNFDFSTKESHSSLYQYIKLPRGARRNSDGFFLRAESFYNVATYLEEIDKYGRKAFKSYGGVSLHKKSHGESFLALVENRFSSNGLYLLDEPEAALSPMSILRLMVSVHELAKKGAQFIISTHSPILMALPDSDVIQFTENGLERVSYKDTEHFQVSAAFLQNPDRMLDKLFDETVA